MDPNGRRILKFPAVRPCESISLATLLSSLIHLTHNIITYKSTFFPTHKKITRQIIRQIQILEIFFQDFQDNNNNSNFSKTLTLCFSDLHFTLQKIHFLLQDCTRPGCRLYILMKSHFIASQFRVFIRSIATSLDILPLNSLDISIEVKEFMELLAKKSQKAQIELDPEDERTMDLLLLILNQFAKKSEPERGSVKRVLGYLGIWSWGDCNKELKFLEEEIDNCEEDEGDIPLLSSLIGFMCYCRGVIFETIEKNDHHQIINQSDSRCMLSCLNPEDFRCPISLELMSDPVIISTGQTYDRSSIQKWLKAGNLLCPKTGERLNSTELIPNSSLKNIIQKFCSDNPILLPKPGRKTQVSSRMSIGPTPSSKEAMRFLGQFLVGRLTYGTDEQKNKAAHEIRLLTKSNTNMVNRSILIELGSVPLLLDLLTSTDPDTQENAIAALLKLSKNSKGQRMIINEGGLMLLIMVLRRGIKVESRQIAAATVFYLCSVDKYRRLIGSTREAIPALIELIKNGSMCGKKNSLAAIFGLLLYQGNHERALEEGLVPVLVHLIASVERPDLLSDSLAVLASLSENNSGCVAILQISALPLITGLVKSSISQSGKEYCVSILLNLSINVGDNVVGILAKEHSLMPSLYSLATQGSLHGGKKARTLISMIQKFKDSR